jgi:hypothetical protein
VTDRPKRPLEEIHRRVDEMFAALMEELDRIDAERDERRAQAIARSGLPVELVESTRLQSPEESATIRNMAQGHSATVGKKTEKRRKNGEGAATYRDPDGLARSMGFADVEEMALAMGQKRVTARSWRSRGYIPSHLNPQVEALKLLRTKKQ